MKVLHVYRTYYPETQGGVEEVIRQLVASTNKNGVENKVVTLTKGKKYDVIEHDGVEVHRFPLTVDIASCGISFKALFQHQNIFEWPDIIHYHFPWPFSDFLHLMLKEKKPSVVTYHSDVVRQRWLLKFYKPLMNYFLKSVDCIVATSENYFATSDVLGRFSDKVTVIPIGIDEKNIEVKSELLTNWKNKVGDDFFLFVGVLRYYKGLHILLDAIKDSPIKVVIAGSGPTEMELKLHADRLGLNNVLFLGYVSDEDKIALIKLSRAIVFPSYLRSEAYGVTLVEGAMYNKPLISTEIGSGTSFVNKHEVTGIVVSPSNPKALRSAMEKLQSDKDLAETLGKNARIRYESLFTASIMGEKYSALYESLLK